MTSLKVGIADYNVYAITGTSANDQGKVKAVSSISGNTLNEVIPKNEETKNQTASNDFRYVKHDGSTMSDAEISTLKQLQQRDRDVRAHEQAHVAAGGQNVSPANFSFETGPDGKAYAVGGEVAIDMSEIPENPDATIVKMQVVRRAALAPKDPSGQDYAVASEASKKESNARSELQQKNVEKYTTESPEQRSQTIDMIA